MLGISLIKLGYKLSFFFFLLASSLSINAQIVCDTFYIEPYPIPEVYFSDNSPKLPPTVNNRNTEFFPPFFYNQYNLPSCGQAAGAFNCLTYEFNRLLNRPADSSSIFAPIYSFNFLNEGNGWFGASAFDSWNINKSQGNPSIIDFAELDFIEDSEYKFRGKQWMNGYNKYYNSMKYRISGYHSLKVENCEDLKILKHYLHDHLKSETPGGTAIFYSNHSFLYSSGPVGLISDPDMAEPYQKRCVYNHMLGAPTHSMTIVGYYENTEVDFNGDGLITDTIDINGDGIVDFHDNEKTFWIIVNTHGEMICNDFFLLKYDAITHVFNNEVYFPVPDATYRPELTFKIKLKHRSRNAIKISAGISNDIKSAYPERIIDFPIFNYQGGNHRMTGIDTIPNSDVLEFGIDITDILKYSEASSQAKIFLIIDNAGHHSGEVQFFSVRQYSENNVREYLGISENNPHQLSPASQFMNAVTIQITPNPDDDILRLEIPAKLNFRTGENIEFQVGAEGGSMPYNYMNYITDEYYQEKYFKPYAEPDSIDFNFIVNQSIIPGWQFPFAGKLWDTIFVGANGTIYFHDYKYSFFERYPYEYAPASWYNDLEITIFAGYRYTEMPITDYVVTDSCVMISWRAMNLAKFRATARLFKDGRIEVSYYDLVPNYHRTAGIKTYTGTYYCELPPLPFSGGINTVMYYPNNYENEVLIDSAGLVSLPPQNSAGKKEFYLTATDNIGNKITRRIELNIMDIDKIDIISFYPNPVTDDFTIEISSMEETTIDIEIFNINGIKIIQKSIPVEAEYNEFKFSSNLLGLSNGIYFCRILYKNSIQTIKFVVL